MGAWLIHVYGRAAHWALRGLSYQSGRHSGCTEHGPGMGGEDPGHIGPEPAGLLRGGVICGPPTEEGQRESKWQS